MVEVSVEVRSGTARFRVAVRAESVERALRLVAERCPSRTSLVAFPTAEDSSAEGLAARAAVRPEELAA
jgi:hypothetical protein